jgi:hypothetical protein
MARLLDLPIELLTLIILYSDVGSIRSLALTSSIWNNIIRSFPDYEDLRHACIREHDPIIFIKQLSTNIQEVADRIICCNAYTSHLRPTLNRQRYYFLFEPMTQTEFIAYANPNMISHMDLINSLRRANVITVRRQKITSTR